ncbi:MAG: alpha-2-macroglobulin family protein, partial [Peptostreptococcales bacterium]
KDTKLNIAFLSQYIPNAYVKMVYFDGSKIHDVGMFNLNYDYSEKELNIKVTPDKDSYKPQETVRLSIEVRDKDNKPSEAEVNISAVDEAFFAMWNQWVDTPGEIYSSAFGPGLISEYYSYQNNQQSPPFAECGEGGDGAELRYDFKDNAYFGTVTTDKNGKGSLEFSLPDNLTSWRLTYQGITKDMKVGSGQENIHAKLPFFLNLLFNDIYLEGDEPAISLRAFGTDLVQGDKVNFKLVLENSDGEEKIIEKTGLAGNYTSISLPSLKSGDYSVSVSAESGKLKDAVKKDFKVVENIIEAAQTEYVDLSDDEAIDAIHSLEVSEENSLTEWVFYNKGISNYYRTLNSLYYSWGQRVDQVLSRKIAGEYLKKYFEEEYVSFDEVDLSPYQIVDGGIALFPYDSSSPLLSAMICSTAKEEFDEVDLRGYFYNKIMDEKTPFSDVALCYWGLAALREPVLLDIYEHLGRKDISLEERLYYGIALAELGDMQEAKDIYFEVLKKHGKLVKPYVYLESGRDRDENIRFTGLNAIIGMKSNLPGHEQLFKYLIDNEAEETLTNLEKLIYLTSKVPDTKKESSFSYKIEDESKEVILKGLDRYRLILSADDVNNMEFSKIKGEMELALNFIGPVKDLANEENTLVDITRSYKINGKEADTFTQSDVVSIELMLDFKKGAPEGYYQITDVLPSGLKYVRPPYMQREGYRWGMENGQKITFMYYYSPKETQAKIVKYLARVIAPGQYTADYGLILHGTSQANGFTKQNRITIVSEEE